MKYMLCVLLCVAVQESLVAGPKQIRNSSDLPYHPSPETFARLDARIEKYFKSGERKIDMYRFFW